jgi:hypothetical protein
MESAEPKERYESTDNVSHDGVVANVSADAEVLFRWSQMSAAERAKYEQRLIRKLDIKLIPLLTLLYLLSFLDRANIGNAKIQGVIFPFVR